MGNRRFPARRKKHRRSWRRRKCAEQNFATFNSCLPTQERVWIQGEIKWAERVYCARGGTKLRHQHTNTGCLRPLHTLSGTSFMGARTGQMWCARPSKWQQHNIYYSHANRRQRGVTWLSTTHRNSRPQERRFCIYTISHLDFYYVIILQRNERGETHVQQPTANTNCTWAHLPGRLCASLTEKAWERVYEIERKREERCRSYGSQSPRAALLPTGVSWMVQLPRAEGGSAAPRSNARVESGGGRGVARLRCPPGQRVPHCVWERPIQTTWKQRLISSSSSRSLSRGESGFWFPLFGDRELLSVPEVPLPPPMGLPKGFAIHQMRIRG